VGAALTQCTRSWYLSDPPLSRERILLSNPPRSIPPPPSPLTTTTSSTSRTHTMHLDPARNLDPPIVKVPCSIDVGRLLPPCALVEQIWISRKNTRDVRPSTHTRFFSERHHHTIIGTATYVSLPSRESACEWRRRRWPKRAHRFTCTHAHRHTHTDTHIHTQLCVLL
jgi:hypothetical protein